MSVPQLLTEPQTQLLEQELESLLAQSHGVSAALLATTDGFEVAFTEGWSTNPPSNMAAMSSSMLSLAVAMVKENGLKPCQNLIIETDSGKVLIMSVPSSRLQSLLTVMTAKEVAFGQLLLEARITVGQLSNILEKM